jgi:hypothetical protein
MRTKLVSSLVAMSLLLAFAPGVPVEASAKRPITWKWSDGSKAGNKTFINGKNAGAYPVIVVTIKPRAIPRIVSIEAFYTNDDGGGTWREENRAQSVNGEVRIQPDPYCAENARNSGCTFTGKYRILIEPSGDQPQYKPSEFQLTWKSSGGSGASGSSGSSSGSSSSGGGISAAFFIGWNLEDVQDALGYDPRTSDCSGWGRSVWWSSNWWVIGVSGGTLMVSKSRGSCT